MALFTLKERKRKMKKTVIETWENMLENGKITESTSVFIWKGGKVVASYDGKNSIPIELNDEIVIGYSLHDGLNMAI